MKKKVENKIFEQIVEGDNTWLSAEKIFSGIRSITDFLNENEYRKEKIAKYINRSGLEVTSANPKMLILISE